MPLKIEKYRPWWLIPSGLLIGLILLKAVMGDQLPAETGGLGMLIYFLLVVVPIVVMDRLYFFFKK